MWYASRHIPQKCLHHYHDWRLYTKKQSKKQSQHISSGQRSPGNHDPKGQFKVCTRTPHYILICIHSLHNTPPGKVHSTTNIPHHNFHNKPNIPHLGNRGHTLTQLKLLHGPSNGETHLFSTPPTNSTGTTTNTPTTAIGPKRPYHNAATPYSTSNPD